MKNVEKAIKLKNELDLLRPLKKDDELRIMQKFRLDWNYHSNHLEGNTLTYGETKALILFGITAQGKPLKDHFEITGHNKAIEWVMQIVKQDRPISEMFIRELHKLILKESYEVDAITLDGKPTKKRVNVGVYKSAPNHVKTKTGEIFRFATPEETPAKMHDLVTWYREKAEKKDTNPILLAADFHYRYIRIHPFDDGNGRTARILMNFILMQFGYPPVIIKTEDKENYFAALRQADAGLMEPFIEYIAKNLTHSLEIMIKGAKGESIEEPDDLYKEIALLEQRLKTVGGTIKKLKSQESLLELYDDSIARLVDKFLERNEIFDRFYARNEFFVYINDKAYNLKKINVIDDSRERIGEETNSIRLYYGHIAFCQLGFSESYFSSSINFRFELTRYKVGYSHNDVVYEKLYSEQLTDQEINNLVDSEIRRHKEEIENRIEEMKKTASEK